MTIGELLKQERIKKGLTQKQFSDEIISTSYYSKVEKNGHRITAEDLIAVLEHNNIFLWSFLKQLSLKSELQHSKNLYVEDAAMDAYYQSDRKQLENLKKQIEAEDIPDKERLSLLISGWIECMKNDDEEPDLQLREDLKNKIFDLPSMDLNKLTLFCNFMEFYDLDTDMFITKQAISKYIDSKEMDIQETLLSIITNLLYLSIKENNYAYTDYLLQNANKISMKPRLFLEKGLISLYSNLIKYHFEEKQEYLDRCKEIVQGIKLMGMAEYGQVLEQIVQKYTK